VRNPNSLRAIVCIAREIDEMFEQFFREDELPPLWSPPIDMFVSDTKVHVTLELPGVPAAQLEVRIGPRTIVVRGEKPVPDSVRQGVSFYESEISYGPFEKRVALPATVMPESHEVSLKDGVLAIVLARSGSRSRVITVE
jgi:HSP20 family protein